MSNSFDEWKKDFVEKLTQNNEWGLSDLTVGENRQLLRIMLQMSDNQEICNFVIIAQVHNTDDHCIVSDHKGVIVTSLDGEDVISFVNRAMEQL